MISRPKWSLRRDGFQQDRSGLSNGPRASIETSRRVPLRSDARPSDQSLQIIEAGGILPGRANALAESVRSDSA